MARIRSAKAVSVKESRRVSLDEILLRDTKQREYLGGDSKVVGRIARNGSYGDANSKLLVETNGKVIAHSGTIDRARIETIDK